MGFVAQARESVRPFMPLAIRRRPALLPSMRYFQHVGLIFIHVPKAAGISVSLSIYSRHFPHHTAAEFKESFPEHFRRLPSFAVVRDPWQRCASAWRFAVQGGGKAPFPLGVPIQDPERYQTPVFASFERFVEEWLPGRDLVAEDPVFQPQHHYIADRRDNVLVSILGRVERIEDLEAELSERLGRKITFPHLNASGTATDYRELYTPRLAEIVGRAYARDAALLGYSFSG